MAAPSSLYHPQTGLVPVGAFRARAPPVEPPVATSPEGRRLLADSTRRGTSESAAGSLRAWDDRRVSPSSADLLQEELLQAARLAASQSARQLSRPAS